MWPRFLNAALGIWLMSAPAVLGYPNPARANDRIVGPLVATLAVVAIWEVTRGLRWVNLVFGFWLLTVPLILGYDQSDAIFNSVAVGLLTMALSFFGGRTGGQYGGGWSSLWHH